MRMPVVALVLLAAAPAKAYTPTHFYGCDTPLALAFSYCDATQSYEARAAWIVNNLTLAEKIQSISPDPDLGDLCSAHTRGVPRLGIPDWSWLTETNSCVLGACTSDAVCPTTFPGGLGVSASFNQSLWLAKGRVIGTELRALMNLGWHRGDPTSFTTLTGYGPNINIVRDPRFGRISELSSEDPLLSGLYAAHYVQGMQSTDAKGRRLMLALLKHFTAYSTENGRGHDDYDISQRDFFETYLPQYELAFKLGKASGVMCSYNGENGHPSCANGWLLNDVLRKLWNQSDAIVSTDCGAVSKLRGPPVSAPTDAVAVAFALMNGTDLEMGSNLFLDNLHAAVSAGLATEERISEAALRLYLAYMRAGRFDPVDDNNPFRKFGAEALNSSSSQRVNQEAGEQSLVLLQNAGGLLPLKRGLKVAVLGPQGVTTGGLLPDYSGNDRNGQTCQTNGQPSYDCIETIADAIAAANTGGTTVAAAGVDVNSTDASKIASALVLAADADVVILALGIDKTIEREGIDRTDLLLPGLQEPFAHQVLALGKPTVLVLTNGGQLAIDSFLSPSGSQAEPTDAPLPAAIIEAFNPSLTGARGVAKHLFGEINRWGKLPYTLYPHNYINQQPMTNYDMAKPPGRTYKYYSGEPLFPFGFGLNYAKLSLACPTATTNGTPPTVATCTVQNHGPVDAEAIVMAYHSVGDDVRSSLGYTVPLKQLRAFDRIRVAARSENTVDLTLGATWQEALLLVDLQGHKALHPGTHFLGFTVGTEMDAKRGLQMDVSWTIQV
jgi:beta-D-xylosidase 4